MNVNINASKAAPKGSKKHKHKIVKVINDVDDKNNC